MRKLWQWEHGAACSQTRGQRIRNAELPLPLFSVLQVKTPWCQHSGWVSFPLLILSEERPQIHSEVRLMKDPAVFCQSSGQ